MAARRDRSHGLDRVQTWGKEGVPVKECCELADRAAMADYRVDKTY